MKRKSRGALAPIGERRLEQRERADDVGVQEGGRPVDRAIDMAFGGQMDQPVRRKIAKRRGHSGAIGDIGVQEAIVRASLAFRDGSQIPA